MEEMPGARRGTPSHLVLSRSWADLYGEIAGLFANRADIRVVVDRRDRGRVDAGRVPMGGGRGLIASLEPVRRERAAS